MAPAAVDENVRLLGDNTAFVSDPVPDNATVCGLLPAPSVNVSVAVREPAAVGLKVMLTMQLADPARLAPQVSPAIVKSPLLDPEIATLLMLIAAGPPLLSVTVWAALVAPTVVAANGRLAGATVAFAGEPTPDNATICGLLPAPSVNVSVAVREPAAVGLKVMLTVQVADPARLAPQVLPAIAKSPLLDPEIATLLILIAAGPPLLSVTVWAALVSPTVVAANVRLPGATVAFAGEPTPDNATVCGLLPAASVNASVAVREPAAVGLKVMLTVQVADPARLAPQVLPAIVKSPLLEPEIATLLMLIAAGPPLLSVTVWTALVAPTVVAANVRLAGVTVAFAGLAGEPVPESATVCGLLPAPSVNVRFAAREPTIVGLKVMLTVQLADGATLAPQLSLLTAKSVGSAPKIVTLFKAIALVPGFCTVTIWLAVADPTLAMPNERLSGATLRTFVAPWVVPDPARLTVSIGFTPECLKVRVAERLPAAVGANIKVTAQFERPASAPLQVLLEMEKSPGSVPEIAILEMLIEFDPAFVNVTI